MRFSTKARYGLRLIIRIARECAESAGPHDPIPLWKLAEREHISKKYVEHIVAQLERAGFVRGHRGPSGGYCLARRPSEITAREVMEAVENIHPNVCTQNPTDCPYYPYSMECMARPMWVGLEEVIRNYLDSITIESLAWVSKTKPRRKKKT